MSTHQIEVIARIDGTVHTVTITPDGTRYDLPMPELLWDLAVSRCHPSWTLIDHDQPENTRAKPYDWEAEER